MGADKVLGKKCSETAERSYISQKIQIRAVDQRPKLPHRRPLKRLLGVSSTLKFDLKTAGIFQLFIISKMENLDDHCLFDMTRYLKVHPTAKDVQHPQFEWFDVNKQSACECMLDLLLQVTISTRSYFKLNTTQLLDYSRGRKSRLELVYINDSRQIKSWIDVVLYFFLNPILARSHGFDKSALVSGSFATAPYGLVCIERHVFFVLCVNLSYWLNSQDSIQSEFLWSIEPSAMRAYIWMIMNRDRQVKAEAIPV